MSKAFEDSYAKLKSVFTSSGSREEEDEEALQEQQEDNENSFVKTVRRVVKLNWKERVIGFAICIAISAFFVIVGCALASLSPAAFAVLFSVGTIAGVFSTFFLVSPISQAKKFIEYSKPVELAVRVISVIVLILAVILAITCGVLKQPVFAVLLAIVQFAALLVYSIALIPYAVDFISKSCKSIFSYISNST